MKTLLAIFFSLLMAAPALAMKNDTGSFRDAEWGVAANSINGLELTGTLNGFQQYRLIKGSLIVGGVQANAIIYAFWDNQLAFVKIMVSDDNAVRIYRACEERFGPPQKRSSFSAEWVGRFTFVEWKRKANEAEVVLASKKILTMKYRQDVKKANRKKGW